MPLAAYEDAFKRLPASTRDAIVARWGGPAEDPMWDGAALRLPLRRFGNVVVAIQPARGYNIDPKSTYHSPDLVPPHNYLALYFWLRYGFDVSAVVHFGKHGNLEWLPGKALALSAACFPEAILGPTPHLYPFIVNDPGEGAQAKRRTACGDPRPSDPTHDAGGQPWCDGPKWNRRWMNISRRPAWIVPGLTRC